MNNKVKDYIFVYGFLGLSAISIFVMGYAIGRFVGTHTQNKNVQPQQETIIAEELLQQETELTEAEKEYAEQLEVEKIIREKNQAINGKDNLGTFKITAYCPCEKCCGKADGVTATGQVAKAGRTIAVDPSIIPYGTKVIINGHTYIAEDTGGAMNGKRIDIFFDNHSEAVAFGVQYADVYLGA